MNIYYQRNDKIKIFNTDSTQIQHKFKHKFNKFNKIWPKLAKFYQNYQHKYNTNSIMLRISPQYRYVIQKILIIYQLY
jgi:hypothetical protein